MKMNKMLSLLLAMALLLGLMAGCGGSAPESAKPAESAAAEPAADEAPETPDAPAPAEPQSTDETAAAEESAAASAAEEAAPEDLNAGLVVTPLPISEEGATFSMYFSQPEFFTAYVETPADNPCFQELEARTNISLEFFMVSAEAEADRFKVLAASGDLPDLIMNGASLYTGGGSKAVEDEVFVNLKPYEDVMPNYFHYVNLNSEFTALLSTDNGSVVDGVYVLNYPSSFGGSGLLIRQDWLDDLGLEMPQTYDEYHDVLTAFKNEKGATSPLQISANCSNQMWAMGFGANCALSDHDNIYDWFGAENDTIVFWPTHQNFRDYLETMQTWYAEGLIDPDWTTRTGGNKADEALIDDSASGLWFSTLTDLTVFDATIKDPKAVVAPAPMAARTADYANTLLPASAIRDRTCVSVTTNCEDPELAAAYLDYVYSEEGQLLSNYGIEGLTFEYGEDGAPVFTDFVLNSETGFPAQLVMVLYGMANFPGVFNPTRFYDQRSLDAMEIWGSYRDAESIYHGLNSAVSLTGDAATEATAILSDIMTLVRETVFRVICNQETMEQYDQMVAEVEGMNIARVVELYQESYDVYMGK